MPKHELKYKPISALDSLEKGRDFIFSALTSHYRIMSEVDAHISLIRKELLLVESLKAQLKREMDCVDFYAKEQNWRTTQGYRAYGSSKGLCINKDDMSNGNYGGKLARETVKAREV